MARILRQAQDERWLLSAMEWVADGQLSASATDKLTLAVRKPWHTVRSMAKVQQTFSNEKDSPIYVSVEPWPECFELEPGEKLTLIWDAPEGGDAAQIDFINERELIVWPNGEIDEMKFLIDGKDAEVRSWTFKHK